MMIQEVWKKIIRRAGQKVELACSLMRLKFHLKQAPHGLSGQLIVSLTSYPPRFAKLDATLVRLLVQTVRPDRVILWIAHGDMESLPRRVKRLTPSGLEIRATKDTGPYKKIIPALQTFPGAFIVTADDDVDYERSWLADFLQAWNGQTNQIAFHRGHEILMGEDGKPRPYKEWTSCITGPRESPMFFPTGAGGIFYPPGSLSTDVLDEHSFMTLCPRADDIWLYWMGRRAGAVYKKTGGRNDVALGRDSQTVALWRENVKGGGNDKYIASLIEKYGWPPTEDSETRKHG